MQQTVNATRMQLTTFRRRLKIAERGHKLLKDKQDEMVKTFLQLARESHQLRSRLQQQLAEASRYQQLAALTTGQEVLQHALMLSNNQVEISYRPSSILGVSVPELEVEGSAAKASFPYGFAETSGNLDQSLTRLAEAFPLLVKLAAIEKAVDLLADELERIRRRVNALEHILIPRLQQNVKFIEMKLDEMERSNIVRLMKINEQREKSQETH